MNRTSTITVVGFTVALLWMPLALHAEPRVADVLSVGFFRALSKHEQTILMVGWDLSMDWSGVTCTRPTTIGERIATLQSHVAFAPTDSLIAALGQLEMRDGCRIAPRLEEYQ